MTFKICHSSCNVTDINEWVPAQSKYNIIYIIWR